MIRISEQVDRETKLVTKSLVRVDIILTHTDHSDIRIVKLLLSRCERLPLNRAAGRVVLRIDIDHEPLAFEVIKPDGLAVLVLEIEIYEALTFLKSHVSSPVFDLVKALYQPDSICTLCSSCDRSSRCKSNSAVRRPYRARTRCR